VAARPFKAYLLSLSAIPDDPRVRRMGDALAARGWEVAGVGLAGARGAPPAWRVHEAPPPVGPPGPARTTTGDFSAQAERWLGRVVAASLAPAEALLQTSGSPYARLVADVRTKIPELDRPFQSLGRAVRRRTTRWAEEARLGPDQRMAAQLHRRLPQLPQMHDIVRALPGPALWIANDWMMLPLAAAGCARAGGVVAYDSHELATEEYAELPEWRRFQRPLVQAIESRFVGEARVVSAVSPGIATHIERLYGLNSARTFTLLNAPAYAPKPFRETGATVRLLYHGVVAPGRGLEACIDAVALLRPAFTLTVRGPGAPEYLQSLTARARAFGDRVTFEPPVPMTQLVDAARGFDIGLMVLPDHSLHASYALPNKLFEYLMAGLAIAVTDLREMGALARSSGAGVTIPALSAEAIAGALNALTTADIDARRRAALEAAKELNWEKQSGPVLDAYEAAMADA